MIVKLIRHLYIKCICMYSTFGIYCVKCRLQFSFTAYDYFFTPNYKKESYYALNLNFEST